MLPRHRQHIYVLLTGLTNFPSERFDHSSDSDHMDDVTGLTSCSKMRLFASCSADGSVRIWDEANRLLRVIKLNATPTSIGFCSQKGDLIVGIGKHLHKISYASCKKAYGSTILFISSFLIVSWHLLVGFSISRLIKTKPSLWDGDLAFKWHVHRLHVRLLSLVAKLSKTLTMFIIFLDILFYNVEVPTVVLP